MACRQAGHTVGGQAVVNQLGHRAMPALQLAGIHHNIAELHISYCQVSVLQL